MNIHLEYLYYAFNVFISVNSTLKLQKGSILRSLSMHYADTC